jgi:hypothetical protein
MTRPTWIPNGAAVAMFMAAASLKVPMVDSASLRTPSVVQE